MPLGAEFVDFSTGARSPWFKVTDALNYPDINIVRGFLPPNPGYPLGSRQLSIVVHEGQPMNIGWRMPKERRTRWADAAPGFVHVIPPDKLIHFEWSAEPAVLVMAFGKALVDEVGAHFGRFGDDVRPEIGVRDVEIEIIGRRWRREMREKGASGPMFARSLAVLSLVRLFHGYAGGLNPPRPKGGLSNVQMQRVMDYIEAHLGETITATQLAMTIQLTTHHFGQAFIKTTGIPQSRFVLERRIERAKELLARNDLSIATDRKSTRLNSSH